MAKHVPFVDGDISTANRLMAAWLNSAQDCLWDVLGDGVNPPATKATARTNLGAGATGDSLFQAATAAAAAAIITGSSFDIPTALTLSGDITVDLTGNQNDWAPTGFATASVIRVTTNGNNDYTISGLAGGADGRVVVIMNCDTTPNTVTLLAQNAGSTNINRFALTDDLVLSNAGTNVGSMCAVLWYDSTSLRWRLLSVGRVLSVATQAQQEAGTSSTVFVSPLRQQFHPSASKFWATVTVSAGTPTLANSYNVTSITDTGTGQLTVTIATDFSSAAWECQVSVERAATALTVANLRYAAVRNGGQAAGSVLVECWDGTAVTANQVDPATWHVSGRGDQ